MELKGSSLLSYINMILKESLVIITKLTNFMELSPSWEASSCAAIQEIPTIL
jgi:hypothetical protein